jgi:hypothetical protein
MRQSGLFSVLCTKRPGVDIVFARGLTEADANLTVAKLQQIGSYPARVAPMLYSDVPGMTRRRRRVAIEE